MWQSTDSIFHDIPQKMQLISSQCIWLEIELLSNLSYDCCVEIVLISLLQPTSLIAQLGACSPTCPAVNRSLSCQHPNVIEYKLVEGGDAL